MKSSSHLQRTRSTPPRKEGVIDNEGAISQGSAPLPARGRVYKYSRKDSRPAITAEKFNQINGFDSNPRIC